MHRKLPIRRGPSPSEPSPPRWLWRLLAATATLLGLFWILGRRRLDQQREHDEAELRASRPQRRAGERLIHLAGRDHAGKSALGNALVGRPVFGPEADPMLSETYRPGWAIHELPSPAVTLGEAALLRTHLQPGDLVVLVIDEQAFHAERDFLDLLQRHFGEVGLLLFINKADLLLGKFTAEEAAELQQSVQASLAGWVETPTDIVWGAADAPGGPDIAAFRERLAQKMGT